MCIRDRHETCQLNHGSQTTPGARDGLAAFTFAAADCVLSVKNTAAGLIFCPFSCKLKSNHVRAVSYRKNDGFDMTCRIKFSKNNGE